MALLDPDPPKTNKGSGFEKLFFICTVAIVCTFLLNMERPGVRKEAVLVFRTAENHILELFRLDEVKGF